MVNRDKNEPSVIAWSIGNEVRGVGKKPSWYDVSKYDLLDVNPSAMNEYTEAVRLMGNVNARDGTRYVLMGGDQERSVPAKNQRMGLCKSGAGRIRTELQYSKIRRRTDQQIRYR